MRLLLVSEGGRDLGGTFEGEPRSGAVTEIVRRTLGEAIGREVHEREIEIAPLPRFNRMQEGFSGYEQKVFRVIQDAALEGRSAVAIVIDRDRTQGVERRRELERGRARAAEDAALHELAGHTALGVAIETVEAWLLADESALTSALGLAPAQSARPDPEGMHGEPGARTHPKTVFLEIVAGAARNGERAYGEVAKHLKLDLLAARCPSGFAPFRDELRQRCK